MPGADRVAGDRRTGAAHRQRDAGGPGHREHRGDLVGVRGDGPRPAGPPGRARRRRSTSPGRAWTRRHRRRPPGGGLSTQVRARGHQCSIEPRKTPARSSSVTSRGAVASSRCCCREPVDQVVDVGVAEADLGEAVGDADVAHQRGQHGRQGVRVAAGDVRVEQPGGLEVPFGRGLEGEPERLGRGQRHRHAVGDDRLVLRVALGAVVPDPAGDRVGVGVRDVHAGVAEAHPGEGRGHRHLLARLGVVAVADGGPERPGQQRQRLLRPHVGDRVGAAVGHPLLGLLRRRTRRTSARCRTRARGRGCPSPRPR